MHIQARVVPNSQQKELWLRRNHIEKDKWAEKSGQIWWVSGKRKLNRWDVYEVPEIEASLH